MRSHQSERTNVLVATGGLALVLLLSPLSSLMTGAVVLTMIGIALTYRLTANPVHVVHVDEDHRPQPDRRSLSRRSPDRRSPDRRSPSRH